MKEKNQLKPTELAKVLGVDKTTITRWRSKGCPYIESKPYCMSKTASRPLYEPEKVIAWLESRNRKEVQA